MDLELRHFRLVTAIADAGSLAAASLQLHLTPSALSHQLRDAEERLGIPLFQRRNRKLLLTGAGEKLLESARRVLAQVDEAAAQLRGEAPHDLLRISTGCYTVYGWLPPVLAKWQREHPRVELRIVLEATRQPIPALLAGQLDLALTTDAPSQPRLARTPLMTDELVLLVPAAHPFAKRRHVLADDLAPEHLLTYDAPREQLDIFTRLLWPAGVEPRRHTRVPLTEALIELVRGGMGVAPLTDWVLPRSMAGLCSVKLTPKGTRRRWAAVRLAARRPPAPLLRFIDLLRQHLGERPA
ncbi:MAG TPA: LysR substrate-binding domain-containing protein [Thermoanaerobaculia bacterium]